MRKGYIYFGGPDGLERYRVTYINGKPHYYWEEKWLPIEDSRLIVWDPAPLDLSKLKIGDVVRNIGSGEAYLIIHKGSELVAVRTVSITNGSEWELVNQQ